MDSTQMWWIVGGIVAVLLLVWLWMRYRKVSGGPTPPQGVAPYTSCASLCENHPYPHQCQKCCRGCSSISHAYGREQCEAGCAMGPN